MFVFEISTSKILSSSPTVVQPIPLSNSIIVFFLLTLINQNNRSSNQITGPMLNTICLSPKTAVTVTSPVCPTPSSAAFCRPTKGQAHHWLLSLNWRLFHLFISSFLPSFSCSPLFWLIIPPSQKKPPPACRRRFLAVYSPSLSLPIPKGCRKTALEVTKATIKTEVVHSILSLKSLQRVSTVHTISYKKHEIILLLVACMQLSWFISDLWVPPPMFQPLST